MQRSTAVAVAIGLLAGVGVVIAATSGVPTTGTIVVSSTGAPDVGIAGGKDITFGDLGPDGETHANISNQGLLKADGDANGNLTVPAGESLDGSPVRVEEISTSGTIGLETASTQRIVVGGNIDNVTWRAPGSVALDDGNTDFSYGGASGTSIVEIGGVPSDTPISAVDANTGTTLDTTTSDGSGRVNFTSLTNSEHDVQLQSAAEPQLTDPAPTGELFQQPTDIKINVSDGDFPSDSVDVAIDLDGSQIDTQTVSSDTRVSTSIPSSGQTGGQHTVDVTATDSTGQTETTQFTYSVPDTLTVYNESDPTQIVKPANVDVQFFGDDEVVTRSTTDGNISLTGLPVTRDMTITVDADGYETRTSYLETIYQQQRVYVVNSSTVTTNQIVFELDDKTGNFPSQDTSLQVEKPITRDRDGDGTNETRFEVVAGDTFGAANEVAADLIGDGQRYKLVVENEDGDRRELGSYTVTGDDRVPLTIGELSFGSQTDSGVAAQASLFTDSGQRYVKFTYADPEQATDSLTYEISRINNNTNLVNQTTVSGPYGRFSTTVAVPASAPDDVAYEITWSSTRSDAPDANGVERVGDIPEIADQTAVDPTVLEYMSFIAIAALTGLVVVFDDRLAALTGTVTATGLTMLGFVSIPPLALGMAGVISVLVNVGRVR